MSHEDPKALDADVLALLRHEKGAVSAPSGAMERVRARVKASSAARGPAAEPGGGGGGATGAGAYAKPLSLVTAFAVGVVAGAAALRVTSPLPAPRVVYVDRPVTVTVPSDPARSSRSPAPATSVDESPKAPVVAAPGASGGASGDDSADQLAAERALLDVARTALARGSGDDALAAVAKHEARFPKGVLSEEREAIAIQALLLSKRYDEARARGARFAHRYPNSVLKPAIDAALSSIP